MMAWRSCLLTVILATSPSLLCSAGAGADDDVAVVSLSEAPRRVSRSPSAVFAFRVMQSSGVPCVGCAVTCKLDGGRASGCGSGNGRGTVSYAGLKDGNHTLAVCASRGPGGATTCATYAWDVDTVPPTASVTAASPFTSASHVSAFISFSEPCDGFTCNQTYCDLIVYGPGRVEPSTLEILRPALRYSVTVTISSDHKYGRLILVMGRGFCTDAAGHRFTRTSNSSLTLHFDKRKDSMNITAGIPAKLLQIRGVTRLVQATNDAKDLRVYLSFAQPVLNSSAEILSVLKATGAVLTPTNSSTLGNRRFGYVVNKVSSDTAIVTVSCDAASITSRQGTPVDSAAEPFTFLYDTQRPLVKLGTWTRRTSSHNIQVLVKFAKPVFNFSSSAVHISGGDLLSFHEASKSIYTLQIQAAADKLVSVQVAENAAWDVAGNPNLPSHRLQVRHYSVPASSSSIATLTTVVFVVTAAVATLLTVSTSSLLASGAISRPSSYMISEPSRNLLRMACHIQMFALSRWLSANLPIEYYEFAKGVEWSIPYMRLPWEGPAAAGMPATAYYSSDRSAARISHQAVMPTTIPTEIPGDGTTMPAQIPLMPMQVRMDGKPLTAMEYRSFFENPDMKPEAQIIMKLQDLDVWKHFGRNMFWLGVIGGGLVLAHALTLVYLKLRYKDKLGGGAAAALVLPRWEIMVVVLAMPCISQAAAALITGGTTGGLAVGIVLSGILTCLLVGLLLFLWLGIAMGRLLQYTEEAHRRDQHQHYWYQELIRRTLLGSGKRGQWRGRGRGLVIKLGPLFEDLRGPPKYMAGGKPATGEVENDDEEEPGRRIHKVLGVVRVHFTFLEWEKRVAVGILAGSGTHSDHHSSQAAAAVSVASLQLLFMVVAKPFIKKRVQLVEMVSLASEVLVFAACLPVVLKRQGSGDGSSLGLAMLGVFMVGFAAQMCNEWYALYRQVRFLGASSSFVEGAKNATAGLLLLVLPSSLVHRRVIINDNDDGEQEQPPPAEGENGSNERSWLRQLREMAKEGFSKDEAPESSKNKGRCSGECWNSRSSR